MNPDLAQENFKTMNWDQVARHHTDHSGSQHTTDPQLRYQDTFKTEFNESDVVEQGENKT